MDTKWIEQKWELEKEKEELYLAMKDLPNISELKGFASNSKGSLEAFTKQIAKDELTQENRIQLETLKSEAEEKAVKVEKLEVKQKSLTARYTEINMQLAVMPKLASKEDVLSLQVKKNEIILEIEKINSTINRLESTLEVVTGPKHPLVKLTTKREKLLAEIVLGENADRKILEDVEKQIREEEKKHSGHVDSAIQASYTISGLRSKLRKLEEKLQLLERIYKDVFNMFLVNEMETHGHKYATLAKEISASFMKIVSIRKLLIKHGGSAGGSTSGYFNFKIPGFALAACQEKDQKNTYGSFMFDYERADIRGAVETLKDELIASGCNLP